MFVTYDTYRVTARIGAETLSLRVSQPDLRGILNVLLFNRATTISVELESSLHDGNLTVSTATTGGT